MPPSTPTPNNPASDDNVWISREEYDRLRSQSVPSVQNVPVVQISQKQAELDYALEKSSQVQRSKRRWQTILGVLLAIGLYFSVASGSAANLWLVLAIVIFGAVSLIDLVTSHSSENVNGVVVPKIYKSNPYKVLTITLLCVTVAPVALMIGFFMLMLTLGGGDMGS
jgi:vacuolar-type H+-ATPase subunit D/Vma8